jgi:hypothetical protein
LLQKDQQVPIGPRYNTFFRRRTKNAMPHPTTTAVEDLEEEHNDHDDPSMDFGDDDERGSSAHENSLTFSSSTGVSRKSGSSNGNVKNEIAHIEKYSATETAQVHRLRLFVVISILVVGAFVSVFSYITLQNDEVDSIHNAVRRVSIEFFGPCIHIPS